LRATISRLATQPRGRHKHQQAGAYRAWWTTAATTDDRLCRRADPLFFEDNTWMLFGDAKVSVDAILANA